MTPEQQAREVMVTELVESGVLDQAWRPAFEQVPRHLFVPDTIWRVGSGGRLRPSRRGEDPAGWLAAAYRNDSVNTQVDDGSPPSEGGWEVTSSASAPSVVATMLGALEVEPGMRVLEIGTGTGWNAALLAYRLGAENVTSIEIDPHLARQARAALTGAGFDKVNVVVGDGVDGWSHDGPYDRVIATAGVRWVPQEWISQTVVGGRVTVPLCNAYHPPGVASLRVTGDGTASGRLGAPVLFMGLRSQREPRPDRGFIDECDVEPDVTETSLHPFRWAGTRDAALAIGQQIGGGVHTHYQPLTEHTGILWLLAPGSRSWASVTTSMQPPYLVEQGGPRRLFDEVAQAYQWWRDAGEPTAQDWLVTVTPGHSGGQQRIELAPSQSGKAGSAG